MNAAPNFSIVGNVSYNMNRQEAAAEDERNVTIRPNIAFENGEESATEDEGSAARPNLTMVGNIASGNREETAVEDDEGTDCDGYERV